MILELLNIICIEFTTPKEPDFHIPPEEDVEKGNNNDQSFACTHFKARIHYQFSS